MNPQTDEMVLPAVERMAHKILDEGEETIVYYYYYLLLLFYYYILLLIETKRSRIKESIE